MSPVPCLVTSRECRAGGRAPQARVGAAGGTRAAPVPGVCALTPSGHAGGFASGSQRQRGDRRWGVPCTVEMAGETGKHTTRAKTGTGNPQGRVRRCPPTTGGSRRQLPPRRTAARPASRPSVWRPGPRVVSVPVSPQDPQYVQQALTHVLLMDAVVGALQSPSAIDAASKLSYFDKMKNESKRREGIFISATVYFLIPNSSCGGTSAVWVTHEEQAGGESAEALPG